MENNTITERACSAWEVLGYIQGRGTLVLSEPLKKILVETSVSAEWRREGVFVLVLANVDM